MTSFTTRLMIAAAALGSVAGIASAQTMEAKIPFAFRAAGKVLPAGTYRVRMQVTAAGIPELQIHGKEPGANVLGISWRGGDAPHAWESAGNPILQFECGVSRCALKTVWMGLGSSVYQLPASSLGKDETRRTAEIAMHPLQGE